MGGGKDDVSRKKGFVLCFRSDCMIPSRIRKLKAFASYRPTNSPL